MAQARLPEVRYTLSYPEWLRYGITQVDRSQLSPDENQLLHAFRNISSSKQKRLLALLNEFRS